MGGNRKNITLIAAMASNRGIGLNGKMPWHLPGELQHFKKTTMGKAMVMGRKTWESIGRALPGRQNIVVSRNPDLQARGCDICPSFQQAVEVARSSEVMVIGGGELYRLALPLANRMILTLVDCECPADTWFPDWSRCDWILVSQRSVEADADNPYSYQVQELARS